MKAQINPHNGKIHNEFIPDLDLCELHRRLAALMNSHIHQDLRGMQDVERQAAMEDVLEQIEEMLAFERMPWQIALEKVSRKADDEYTAHPTDQRSDEGRRKIYLGFGRIANLIKAAKAKLFNPVYRLPI